MTADSSAALPSIGTVRHQIAAARPPHGDTWDLRTIVDQRVHVSRTPTDRAVVFVEGDRASFGDYGRLPGATSLHIKDMDTSRDFESVQIPAPAEALGGDQALAHIVYEMANVLSANPKATNEELLLAVRWVLGLLGTKTEILPVEVQVGLAGECHVLRELLALGFKEEVGAATVLERWVDGQRDFAARGVSIEVKTTALNARVHHIGSIDQLEPRVPGEAVFVYSVGIKQELLHDRKLTTYVDEVVALLVTHDGVPDLQARARFSEKLQSRGYHESHRPVYEVGPGLMVTNEIPGRLYSASELDYLRLRSFKNESLPSMVRNVGYDLELPDGGSQILDQVAVFRTLITSDPI